MSKSLQPIAIFDSGVGGLTVVKALTALLPHESIFYVADTLSRPFGTKSADHLELIVQRNLELILSHSVKMIVIACHTASSCSPALFQGLPIPILPIFPTSAHVVHKISHSSSLLVMGTQRTISSNIYKNFFEKHYPHIKVDYLAASPLEHLIESECKDPHLIESTLQKLLSPLEGRCYQGAILACTHFPIYQHFIQKALGDSVQVLDPAPYFSECIYEALASKDLLNPSSEAPTHHYLITGDLAPFKRKLLSYFEGSLGKTSHFFIPPYISL